MSVIPRYSDWFQDGIACDTFEELVPDANELLKIKFFLQYSRNEAVIYNNKEKA